MNRTLESIQDNTSVGAQALSSAATDLKQAGEAFRQQMNEAARDGGDVARARIEATGVRIAGLTDELTSKVGQQLMSPLGEIAAQMQEVANQVAGASADFRKLSSDPEPTRQLRQLELFGRHRGIWSTPHHLCGARRSGWKAP